jgi:hypothetical protein
MRKIFLFMLLITSYCQAQQTYHIVYQNPALGYVFDKPQTILTHDNGIVNADGYGQLEVLKFDSVGMNEWVNTFNVPNFPGCYLYPGGIVELEDHGYLISGSIDFGDLWNNVTLFLLKIDSIGNLVSFKIAADTMRVPPAWVISISKSSVSNNYIVSGLTSSPSTASRSFMIQIDSAENILWTKKFSSDSINHSASTVCKNVENGNIVCAIQIIDSVGTLKLNVTKFDQFGNLIWSNLFSTDMTYGNVWDLVEKDNSYYIFAQRPGVTSYDPHIFKVLKSTGALEWHTSYSDFHISYPNTIKTSDDRLLFNTWLDSSLATGVFELDSTGNIIHATKYSFTTFPFYILSIIQNQFDEVILYGKGVVNNPFYGNCILSVDSLNQFPCISVPVVINPPVFYQDSVEATGYVVADSMSFLDITSLVVTGGLSLTPIDACNFVNIHQQNLISFQIYPNPTTRKLKIRNEGLKIERVDVYNLIGEKVYSISTHESQQQIEIDLTNQSPGIYVVRIQTVAGVFTEKVIKK